MKPIDRSTALRELRALVGTYLEGSDDAARAAELLDVLDVLDVPSPAAELPPIPDETAREMFGRTATAIDEVLAGKSPRGVAMYAMETLSIAQGFFHKHSYDGGWRVATRGDAHALRQLINIAKYAIDKAVPR